MRQSDDRRRPTSQFQWVAVICRGLGKGGSLQTRSLGILSASFSPLTFVLCINGDLRLGPIVLGHGMLAMVSTSSKLSVESPNAAD